LDLPLKNLKPPSRSPWFDKLTNQGGNRVVFCDVFRPERAWEGKVKLNRPQAKLKNAFPLFRTEEISKRNNLLSHYILLPPKPDKSGIPPLFLKERGKNTEGVTG